MKNNYKYKAFISYSHTDIKFARWLHKKIENYKIPKKLREKYPRLPKDLKRSVFRDEEELPTAYALPDNLSKALENSEFLIVIASPFSVASKWVNQEIEYFKNYHKNANVLAIIKEGEPHAKEGQLEAFPKALTANNTEPIAGDARTYRGRKRAFLKLIAGILGVDFADLWEREKKEKRKHNLWIAGVITLFTILFLYASLQFTNELSNNELKEINEKIAVIEYALRHDDLNETKIITLNQDLKKLQQDKINKEDSQKSLGLLKTELGEKANKVYKKEGAKPAIKILTSRKALATREQKKRELSKESIALAKLYVETYEFDKAFQAYEEALNIFFDYENAREYGYFLEDQDRIEKVIALNQKMLQSKLSKSKKTKVLINLAVQYQRNNQFKNAENLYSQALGLLMHLKEKESREYKENRTDIFINLAVIHQKKNQFEKAEKMYLKALKQAKELVHVDAKKYTRGLTLLLRNLGGLYKRMGNFKKSEKLYREALSLNNKTSEQSSNKEKSNRADTFNDLAMLYQDTNRIQEAQRVYIQSLNIRKSLARKNPEAYTSDLSDSFNNIAGIYLIQEEFSKAEHYFKKSIALGEALIKRNPDRYKPVLMQRFYNLATLYIHSKHYTDSEKFYHKALLICKELHQKNPHIYNENLLSIYGNMAVLFSSTKRLNKSLKMHKKVLVLSEKLAKKNPSVFDVLVINSLTNIGNIYQETHQKREAEEAYKKSLNKARVLVKNNPKVYTSILITTLANRAEFYRLNNQVKKAEEAFEENLIYIRELVKENPKVYNNNLAQLLYNFSRLLDSKDFNKSIKMLEESVKLRENLTRENPDVYSTKLGDSLSFLALSYSRTGQKEQAKRKYLQLLKIRETLSKKNPKKNNSNLANTLNALASIYTNLPKHHQEAKSLYQRSIELYRTVETLSVFEQYQFSSILNSMAKLHQKDKKIKKAEALFIEALEIRMALRTEAQFADLASTTLVNLANLYTEDNKTKKAKKTFLQALSQKRVLGEKDVKRYGMTLMFTLVEGVNKWKQPLKDLDQAENILHTYFKNHGAIPIIQSIRIEAKMKTCWKKEDIKSCHELLGLLKKGIWVEQNKEQANTIHQKTKSFLSCKEGDSEACKAYSIQ